MDFEFVKTLDRQSLIDLQEAVLVAFENLPTEIVDTPAGPFCTDPSLIVCPSCRELFGIKRPEAKHLETCIYVRAKKNDATR